MKYLISVLLSLILILNASCATEKPFSPPKLEPSKFDKTEPYKLDLSSLEAAKPTAPPIPVYANMDDKTKTITVTNNPKNANCVVFTTPEYAKFGAIIHYASVLKEVTVQEEGLINTRINEINALKELCAIKDAQIEQYRNMYIEAMTLYDTEKKAHHRDNVRHDFRELVLFGGAVALVAIL